MWRRRRRSAIHDSPVRHVRHHSAPSRYGHPIPHYQMPRHPRLAADGRVMPDLRAPRDPHQRHQQSMFPNARSMPNRHQVADLGPGPDDRLPQRRPLNRDIRSDLDVIVHSTIPTCGIL